MLDIATTSALTTNQLLSYNTILLLLIFSILLLDLLRRIFSFQK